MMDRVLRRLNTNIINGSSTKSYDDGKLLKNSIPIFGSSLEALFKRDNSNVPLFCINLCEIIIRMKGLETEGIFRKNGSSKILDFIKSEINYASESDMNETIHEELEKNNDVHSAASLLKMFLRDLPDDIIPVDLTDEFMKVMSHENSASSPKSHSPDAGLLSKFEKIIGQLPPYSYSLLQYLCNFLHQVSKYENVNKMSSNAIGIVFGPCIFPQKFMKNSNNSFNSKLDNCLDNSTTSFNQSQDMQWFAKQNVLNQVMSILIDKAPRLFRMHASSSVHMGKDVQHSRAPSSAHGITAKKVNYPGYNNDKNCNNWLAKEVPSSSSSPSLITNNRKQQQEPIYYSEIFDQTKVLNESTQQKPCSRESALDVRTDTCQLKSVQDTSKGTNQSSTSTAVYLTRNSQPDEVNLRNPLSVASSNQSLRSDSSTYLGYRNHHHHHNSGVMPILHNLISNSVNRFSDNYLFSPVLQANNTPSSNPSSITQQHRYSATTPYNNKSESDSSYVPEVPARNSSIANHNHNNKAFKPNVKSTASVTLVNTTNSINNNHNKLLGTQRRTFYPSNNSSTANDENTDQAKQSLNNQNPSNFTIDVVQPKHCDKSPSELPVYYYNLNCPKQSDNQEPLKATPTISNAEFHSQTKLMTTSNPKLDSGTESKTRRKGSSFSTLSPTSAIRGTSSQSSFNLDAPILKDNSTTNGTQDNSNPSMTDPEGQDEAKKLTRVMARMERELMERRIASNIPDTIEDMTPKEVEMEKHIIQSILLDFEKFYGRPKTRAGRFIVRPIYNRYRDIKKLLPNGSQASIQVRATEKVPTNGCHPVIGTTTEEEAIDRLSKDPLNGKLAGSQNDLDSSRRFLDHIIQYHQQGNLDEPVAKQEWFGSLNYLGRKNDDNFSTLSSVLSQPRDDYHSLVPSESYRLSTNPSVPINCYTSMSRVKPQQPEKISDDLHKNPASSSNASLNDPRNYYSHQHHHNSAFQSTQDGLNRLRIVESGKYRQINDNQKAASSVDLHTGSNNMREPLITNSQSQKSMNNNTVDVEYSEKRLMSWSLAELKRELEVISNRKKSLQKVLRNFEHSYERQTGMKITDSVRQTKRREYTVYSELRIIINRLLSVIEKRKRMLAPATTNEPIHLTSHSNL